MCVYIYSILHPFLIGEPSKPLALNFEVISIAISVSISVYI